MLRYIHELVNVHDIFSQIKAVLEYFVCCLMFMLPA
jgi:hypothetical protein